MDEEKVLSGSVYSFFGTDPQMSITEAIREAADRCDGRFPLEVRMSLHNWLIAYEGMSQHANCRCCYHRTRDLNVIGVPIKAVQDASCNRLYVLCADGSTLEICIV